MYLCCAPVLQGSLHRHVRWLSNMLWLERSFFGSREQGKGEDASEKQNPKHSSVNKLINNWQGHAKYYRTLILTRCSSLTRLIKHDQHHKRKHRWPKRNNCVPCSLFFAKVMSVICPWGWCSLFSLLGSGRWSLKNGWLKQGGKKHRPTKRGIYCLQTYM